MEKTIIITDLKSLNEKIEKEKTVKNWYKSTITEKNKTLILAKSTLEILQKNGVKLEKTYISYNNSPNTYNAIMEILQKNPNHFIAR